MPKQTIRRAPLIPFVISTLTSGTYPGIILTIGGQNNTILSATAPASTATFAVSVSGVAGNILATTNQSTATISLAVLPIQPTTFSNINSLTVDPYGRISGYETNILQGGATTVKFPSTISVNTSGFIAAIQSASNTTASFTTLTLGVGIRGAAGAILESITSLSGATGVVTHNFNLGNQWIHSSIAGNFTANFTNIPSTTNNMINTVLILNQGATPYMPTAVQINGVAQTIKWFASSAPTGIANRTEFVSFSLCNINGSWIVLGSKSSYG